MENTTNEVVRGRDLHYYRQRYKNRTFNAILDFFEEEADRLGVTKKDLAYRLGKEPSQITRWLNSPTNLTLETISDILLALGAEPEPSLIVRFCDRVKPNYAHHIIARAEVSMSNISVVNTVEKGIVASPRSSNSNFNDLKLSVFHHD